VRFRTYRWAVADDLASMDTAVADLSSLFAKWHSFLLRQVRVPTRQLDNFGLVAAVVGPSVLLL